MRVLRLTILLALVWALVTHASAQSAANPKQPSPHGPTATPQTLLEGYLQKHWPALKARLLHMARRESSVGLYSVQEFSNLYLDWAIENRRDEIVEELVQIYAEALPRLQRRSEYLTYGGIDGGSKKYEKVPAARSFYVWTDRTAHGDEEIILNVAQFLFVTTRAISALKADHPLSKSFAPILKDHYFRWIFGVDADPEKGPFQRLAWNCGSGRFNQAVLVRRLIRKGFSGSSSYCNVVTDVELWIIAGAVELLALDAKHVALAVLSPSDRHQLKDFLSSGVELLKSRTQQVPLIASGVQRRGLMFDSGSWADHPAWRYSGVTTATYPTPIDLIGNPPPKDISIDISHARRFVQVFETLYRHKALTESSFPEDATMAALATQLTFGVFSGDTRKPLFKNYMNGANGWYRIGYAGRSGFGYRPYGLSNEWYSSGYCRLTKYNPEVSRICMLALSALLSADPDVVRYREVDLRSCHYQDFMLQQCAALDLSEASEYVLNFLASTAN